MQEITLGAGVVRNHEPLLCIWIIPAAPWRAPSTTGAFRTTLGDAPALPGRQGARRDELDQVAHAALLRSRRARGSFVRAAQVLLIPGVLHPPVHAHHDRLACPRPMPRRPLAARWRTRRRRLRPRPTCLAYPRSSSRLRLDGRRRIRRRCARDGRRHGPLALAEHRQVPGDLPPDLANLAAGCRACPPAACHRSLNSCSRSSRISFTFSEDFLVSAQVPDLRCHGLQVLARVRLELLRLLRRGRRSARPRPSS